MTTLTREEKVELVKALAEKERRSRMRNFFSYFPDDGPYRRDLYQKHLEFFRLGYDRAERVFMAANRVGKTESGGGYELTCHLTGLYPVWWEGRRFSGPISAWAAGDTSQSVKEILQAKMLGKPDQRGTGVIPGALLGDSTSWVGVPESVRSIQVKHVSGMWSTLTFKSYDQKRISFQGTEQHAIWLDEEPPEDIVDECRLRTTATGAFKGGILMATFTPIEGVTPYIQAVLQATAEPNPHMALIGAGWDDVPHIDESEKRRLLATMSAHQIEARTKGRPTLGSGAIYPVSDDAIKVPAYVIPKHWPRICAIDFGVLNPAVVWGAVDRDADAVVIYDCWKNDGITPVTTGQHADIIKARMEWIPVAWPHDGNGADRHSGVQFSQQMRDKGVAMLPEHAQHAESGLGEDTRATLTSVEAGLQDIFGAMTEGRFKVFEHLDQWFNEKNYYYRKDGVVVKSNDHLMDASRYLWISRRFAQLAPRQKTTTRERPSWKTV